MDNQPSSNDVKQESAEQSSAVPLSDNLPVGKGESCNCNNKDNARIDSLEKEAKSTDIWMALLTGLIAAITFGGVVVASFQWKTMKDQSDTMQRQLDEMRSSGEQTDKLIAQVTAQAKAANRLAEIANESLDETRRQFQRDQRPFLVPNMVPRPGVTDSKIAVDIHMINYGKTPALRTGGLVAIFSGADALSKADKWFEREAPKAFGVKGELIVPQGIPPTPEFQKYLTLEGNKLADQEDFISLLDKDMTIAVVGRFIYFDTAGNRYWTDLCYSNLATKAVLTCPKHNEVH